MVHRRQKRSQFLVPVVAHLLTPVVELYVHGAQIRRQQDDAGQDRGQAAERKQTEKRNKRHAISDDPSVG